MLRFFPGCESLEIRGSVLDYENGCFRRYRVYVAGWHPELSGSGRRLKSIIGFRGDTETEIVIEGIWPVRTFEVLPAIDLVE